MMDFTEGVFTRSHTIFINLNSPQTDHRFLGICYHRIRELI
jgi:hypothetical protein